MRYRRNVANQFNFNSSSLNRTNSRFSPGSWSFDTHFTGTHSAVTRDTSSFIGRLLRCKWSSFTRATKAHCPRRTLGNQIALQVGDADQRVVEGSLDMNYPLGNDLLFFFLKNLLFACGLLLLCHNGSQWSAADGTVLSQSADEFEVYFLPATFFLATVARRGPLRVRAFV